MSDEPYLQLESSLSRSKEKAATSYRIPITIRNASSMGFQKAEVAVKDEDSNQVATAYFGHIPSRSSATESVNLPGGVLPLQDHPRRGGRSDRGRSRQQCARRKHHHIGLIRFHEEVTTLVY